MRIYLYRRKNIQNVPDFSRENTRGCRVETGGYEKTDVANNVRIFQKTKN